MRLVSLLPGFAAWPWDSLRAGRRHHRTWRSRCCVRAPAVIGAPGPQRLFGLVLLRGGPWRVSTSCDAASRTMAKPRLHDLQGLARPRRRRRPGSRRCPRSAEPHGSALLCGQPASPPVTSSCFPRSALNARLGIAGRNASSHSYRAAMRRAYTCWRSCCQRRESSRCHCSCRSWRSRCHCSLRSSFSRDHRTFSRYPVRHCVRIPTIRTAPAPTAAATTGTHGLAVAAAVVLALILESWSAGSSHARRLPHRDMGVFNHPGLAQGDPCRYLHGEVPARVPSTDATSRRRPRRFGSVSRSAAAPRASARRSIRLSGVGPCPTAGRAAAP